jgi:hypothetical protein
VRLPRPCLASSSHQLTSTWVCLTSFRRRKDLVLIKYLVLERNADVFVRDRRGNRVLDNLPAGDHVSNLLKQASNNQKALAQRKEDGSPVTQRCVRGIAIGPSFASACWCLVPPLLAVFLFPAFRGYLLKYTNVAHGYKSRWFVIESGVLSCQYRLAGRFGSSADRDRSADWVSLTPILAPDPADFRSQEEENKACRGSISLKFATLKSISSTSFDIQPATHDSRFPKYSLRASHPQEAAIWCQSIKQHISFYGTGGAGQLEDDGKKRHSLSIRRLTHHRTSKELNPDRSDASAPLPASLGVTPIDGSSTTMPRTLSRVPSFSGGKTSLPVTVAVTGPSPAASQAHIPYSVRSSSPGPSLDGTVDDDFESSPVIGQGPLQSVKHVSIPGIPYGDRYELLANSTRQHLEVTDQLLSSLVIVPGAAPLSPSAGAATSPTKPSLMRTLSTASSRQQTVKDSLRQSLKVLSDLTVEFQHMSLERERWLVARYQHEVDTRRLWEESMQDVAKEQADLESQLREAGEENRRHIKEIKAVRLMSPGYAGSGSAAITGASPFGARPDSVVAPADDVPPTLSNLQSLSGKELPAVPTGVDPADPDVKIAMPTAHVSDGGPAAFESDDEEEDDDEFCTSTRRQSGGFQAFCWR